MSSDALVDETRVGKILIPLFGLLSSSDANASWYCTIGRGPLSLALPVFANVEDTRIVHVPRAVILITRGLSCRRYKLHCYLQRTGNCKTPLVTNEKAQWEHTAKCETTHS